MEKMEVTRSIKSRLQCRSLEWYYFCRQTNGTKEIFEELHEEDSSRPIIRTNFHFLQPVNHLAK